MEPEQLPSSGLWSSLKTITPKKIAQFFSILVLVAAIPLTVFIAQQQQVTEQHASGQTCGSYLPGAPSGFYWVADCGHQCSSNGNCPQNTNDCNVNPSSSNWCYGFEGPNNSSADWRCLMLHHPGTDNVGPNACHVTGSYTGSYTSSYTGAYTTSYTGVYTSSYTNTYTTTYTTTYTGSYTPSPTATPIPTPTPTPAPNATMLGFSLTLTGIGNGGANQNPVHRTRNATVCLYPLTVDPSGDPNCSKIASNLKVTGSATFDSNSGTFTSSNFNAGTGISSGQYIVLVKVDNFLRKRLGTVQTITAGVTNPLGAVTLLPGDVDNNNVADINDYNGLIACYAGKFAGPSCLFKHNGNMSGADLNDDGKVDGVDYNLFVRSLAVQLGD